MIIFPALLGEKDAAAYLGIGATTLRGLGIRRRVLGGRRLYDRRDLDAYADALPYEDDPAPKSAVDQWFEGDG